MVGQYLGEGELQEELSQLALVEQYFFFFCIDAVPGSALRIKVTTKQAVLAGHARMPNYAGSPCLRTSVRVRRDKARSLV